MIKYLLLLGLLSSSYSIADDKNYVICDKNVDNLNWVIEVLVGPKKVSAPTVYKNKVCVTVTLLER